MSHRLFLHRIGRVLVGAFFSFVFTASTQASDLIDELVTVRAVETLGGVPVALLNVADVPTVVMVDMNVPDLPGTRVSAIDVAHSSVTLTTISGKRVVALNASRTIKLLDFTSAQVDEIVASYDRERAQISFETVRSWRSLDAAGREAVVLDFLVRGYAVAISRSGQSATTGLLFEQRWREVRQARRETFLSSLDPAQRARFGRTSVRAIKFNLPKAERDAQIAAAESESREQKANEASVLAELTPAQRALYDTWQHPMPAGSN